jgi:hypothetical protein
VGPRACLDTEAGGKFLCLCRRSNRDCPIVQSVVRHYTDWATRALKGNHTRWMRQYDEWGKPGHFSQVALHVFPWSELKVRTRESCVVAVRKRTWVCRGWPRLFVIVRNELGHPVIVIYTAFVCPPWHTKLMITAYTISSTRVLSFWSRPPSARSSISSFIMFVAYNSRSSIHELFILRLKFMSFRSVYIGCGR